MGAFGLKSFVVFDKFVVFILFESDFLHLLVNVDVKIVVQFSVAILRTSIKRLQLLWTELVSLDWLSLLDFFKFDYHHTKALLEGEFLVVKVLASAGVLVSRDKLRIHFFFDCLELMLLPLPSCFFNSDSLVVK